MRAVAAKMASTVARARSWRGSFRGAVAGRAVMTEPAGMRVANASVHSHIGYAEREGKPMATKNRYRPLRGVLSVLRLIRDPNKLGEVFTLSDSMVRPRILDELIETFSKDPRGA